MLERNVEYHLTKQVSLAKGRAYKWCSPSQRGVSDRIVFVYGQVWFVELKRPGGKLRKLQELFAEFAKQFTPNVITISTIEDVDSFLEKLRNSHYSD